MKKASMEVKVKYSFNGKVFYNSAVIDLPANYIDTRDFLDRLEKPCKAEVAAEMLRFKAVEE
jgi:putative transposon-encoded protein